MPTYEYQCSNCEHGFYAAQSIKDEPLKRCPECKKHKLVRQFGTPEFFVMGAEAKTVGELAKRNTGKMSADQYVDRLEGDKVRYEKLTGKKKKKKPPKPWWRDTDKPLDLKKIRNVQKYVETGETG